MGNKHTPEYTQGEWDLRSQTKGRTAIDVGSPSEYVCTVHGRTEEQALANAKLIAAAPELLEAAIRLLESPHIKNCPHGAFSTADSDNYVRAEGLRRAIQKAAR